jgi:hypothetical protein
MARVKPLHPNEFPREVREFMAGRDIHASDRVWASIAQSS